MLLFNEAQTRRDLIDPALGTAGWNIADKKQPSVGSCEAQNRVVRVILENL